LVLRLPIENEEKQEIEKPSDGNIAKTEGFSAVPKLYQPTFFDLPSEKEQIATINANLEAENAKRPVIITEEDIETALISWNNDVASKVHVYEHMLFGENALTYETAEFLKNEFGNSRDLFNVTKEGAMPFEISWENVQFRLNSLIDEGRFLTPQDWAYVKEQAQNETQSQPESSLAEQEPATIKKSQKSHPEHESTGLPITKGISKSFHTNGDFYYAKANDGSLYISNGNFIIKTAENDIETVAKQINKGKRSALVVPKETPNILTYIQKAQETQGTYELSQAPHVISENQGKHTLIPNCNLFQTNKIINTLTQKINNRLNSCV